MRKLKLMPIKRIPNLKLKPNLNQSNKIRYQQFQRIIHKGNKTYKYKNRPKPSNKTYNNPPHLKLSLHSPLLSSKSTKSTNDYLKLFRWTLINWPPIWITRTWCKIRYLTRTGNSCWLSCWYGWWLSSPSIKPCAVLMRDTIRLRRKNMPL